MAELWIVIQQQLIHNSNYQELPSGRSFVRQAVVPVSIKIRNICEFGTAITMRKQFLFDVCIVGLCLRIGYIAKHWVEDMNNKYIPTICAVVGLILAIWLSGWDI